MHIATKNISSIYFKYYYQNYLLVKIIYIYSYSYILYMPKKPYITQFCVEDNSISGHSDKRIMRDMSKY